jgi:hypothetical protein
MQSFSKDIRTLCTLPLIKILLSNLQKGIVSVSFQRISLHMIQYNPKVWFALIFKAQKGDTLRILFPLMILIGVYTGIVVFIEKEYLKLDESSHH